MSDRATIAQMQGFIRYVKQILEHHHTDRMMEVAVLQMAVQGNGKRLFEHDMPQYSGISMTPEATTRMKEEVEIDILEAARGARFIGENMGESFDEGELLEPQQCVDYGFDRVKECITRIIRTPTRPDNWQNNAMKVVRIILTWEWFSCYFALTRYEHWDDQEDGCFTDALKAQLQELNMRAENTSMDFFSIDLILQPPTNKGKGKGV